MSDITFPKLEHLAEVRDQAEEEFNRSWDAVLKEAKRVGVIMDQAGVA